MSCHLGSQGLVLGSRVQCYGCWSIADPVGCVGSSCLALGMLLCRQWCPRKDLSRVGACFVMVCPS